MADSTAYFEIDHPPAMPNLGRMSDGLPRGVFQCLCPICLKLNTGVDMRKTSRYSEYDLIAVEKTKELTAHQYLLCSDSMWAFVMKDRIWSKWIRANIASCSRI